MNIKNLTNSDPEGLSKIQRSFFSNLKKSYLFSIGKV